MYAIVDVETTGGPYMEEGIMEIAIYQFNGQEITDQFISLLNPERSIHPYVTNLTGINHQMLKTAPKFHEVAKRIVEITENCVLVAHNAPFDYNMLKTEFKRLGYTYIKQTLCTVQLSRKLIPGKESYSLEKLARSLGIPVVHRHRAHGDALATLHLFKILLAKDFAKNILKKAIKEDISLNLKPDLLRILETLPAKTGVYYLHQRNGAVIYIGKGRNIRAKANSHFTSASKTAQILKKRTISITYEETGNELIANLKAREEIDKNKPFYNSASYNQKIRPNPMPYPYENMLLIDKGRDADERSVLLIENNRCKGYGFFNLNYQLNNIHILRNIITQTEYSPGIDNLIKRHLRKNNTFKIIPF